MLADVSPHLTSCPGDAVSKQLRSAASHRCGRVLSEATPAGLPGWTSSWGASAITCQVALKRSPVAASWPWQLQQVTPAPGSWEASCSGLKASCSGLRGISTWHR